MSILILQQILNILQSFFLMLIMLQRTSHYKDIKSCKRKAACFFCLVLSINGGPYTKCSAHAEHWMTSRGQYAPNDQTSLLFGTLAVVTVMLWMVQYMKDVSDHSLQFTLTWSDYLTSARMGVGPLSPRWFEANHWFSWGGPYLAKTYDHLIEVEVHLNSLHSTIVHFIWTSYVSYFNVLIHNLLFLTGQVFMHQMSNTYMLSIMHSIQIVTGNALGEYKTIK